MNAPYQGYPKYRMTEYPESRLAEVVDNQDAGMPAYGQLNWWDWSPSTTVSVDQ
jgi:hypothetical protein